MFVLWFLHDVQCFRRLFGLAQRTALSQNNVRRILQIGGRRELPMMLLLFVLCMCISVFCFSCAWGVFVVILVSSMILSLLLIIVLVVSYVCLVAAVFLL